MHLQSLRRRLGILAIAAGLFLWGATAPASGGLIRFLVAEYSDPVHHDSFVITIDEAETTKIAHARDLIAWVQSGADPATSPGDTIVLAPIAAGADGINRNYLVPGAPPWSWHVSGPVEFAFATIEILDGWPTFVEEDVAGWMANTNGFIGFWSYTVVQELGPVEEIPEPPAFLLSCAAFWMGTLYRFRQRSCS